MQWVGSEYVVIANSSEVECNYHPIESRYKTYAAMSDKIDDTCDTGKDLEDVMQDEEKIPTDVSIVKVDKVDFSEGDLGFGTEDSSLGTSRERVSRESEHVHLEEHGRRSSRTPKPRVVYFAELPPVSHTGHANNSNHGHSGSHNQHSSTRNSNNNNNNNNTNDESHTNEDGDDDNEMPDSQSGLGSALPAVRRFFSTRLEQVVTFLGGYIDLIPAFVIIFISLYSNLSINPFTCVYMFAYNHFYLYSSFLLSIINHCRLSTHISMNIFINHYLCSFTLILFCYNTLP